jgi:hypothetical protein
MEDVESSNLFARSRAYHQSMGCYSSRDVAGYVDGQSLYRGWFVPNANDSRGKWTENVHRDKTAFWAIELGLPIASGNTVGEADNGVDSKPWIIGGTGPMPWQDQSYHFRLGPMGGDSRQVRHDEHVQLAKNACTRSAGRDDYEESLTELGKALHPLQDIVAHGGLAEYDNNGIYWPHNYFTPVEGQDWHTVDDINGPPACEE